MELDFVDPFTDVIINFDKLWMQMYCHVVWKKVLFCCSILYMWILFPASKMKQSHKETDMWVNILLATIDSHFLKDIIAL